ncbi:hypothetical protein IC762_18775 [Bradyrhizobium genosp. L]|uniref:right-handed parallel beta-helix repeat-containing protein n=1 Tax=Bradyrhizobium genosp. L TaxID=83637 RepID=UPI0018A26254|nr:right-handed parallel beta-helix repeat-containing protein [Bradyrhizobium genosp. L]QPF81849.1 hypothetical protein IC762_18775 [Bradyrhizobium genosp. L]
MKRVLCLIAIVLAAAVLAVRWTSEVRAQNFVPNTTYVSHNGNDANACSLAAPCATFTRALAVTPTNGSLSCLDAGYFGGIITITSGVTIDCLAGGGGTNVYSIKINAGGDKITLRNLVVNEWNASAGSAPAVIEIVAANTVYIENVLIARSASEFGIYDHRNGPGVLAISNSSIVQNEGPGIVVSPGSGIIGAELDNVKSAFNTYGLAVGSGGRVMIKNSVFTDNATTGIQVDGGGFVSISSSEISFNQTGVAAQGTVSLQGSTVVSNTTAIQGATQSLGNNRIFANVHDGNAPTIVSGQ